MSGSLLLLFVVASLVLAIYCIADVARQPALSSGQKTAWIVGFAAGWLFFAIIGVVLAVAYLAAVRPKLRP